MGGPDRGHRPTAAWCRPEAGRPIVDRTDAVECFARAGASGMGAGRVGYRRTGADASGHVVTQRFDIAVSDVYEAPLPISVRTGFEVEYFALDRSIHQLSDVDWKATPDLTDRQQHLDYEVTEGSFWKGGPSNRFALRASGGIMVEEGGTYTFRIVSDDGSRVTIDGEPLLENDRQHSMITVQKSITLEPGWHSMEVLYFENQGSAGLTFEMKAPGESGFSLVEVNSDFIEQGQSIHLPIVVDGAGDIHSVGISGLPNGTYLSDGTNARFADGDEIRLDGWEIDQLEIQPPQSHSGEIDMTIRVTGTRDNGQSFDSTRTLSLEVLPSGPPSSAPQGEPYGAGAEMSEASWVESSDPSHSTATNADDDAMSAPAEDPPADDQTTAYDHYH